MEDRFVITPYFIDEEWPGLLDLAGEGWQVNRAEMPAGDQQGRISILHESLASFVQESIARGDRPVSIAGDCCTTIGVLAGLQRAGINPTLIWFDAHGDFNTWETSPSGFLGGMPLAMLVGRGDQTMPRAVGLRSLPEDEVILTDGRDLDPGERISLEGSGVKHIPDVRWLLREDLADVPLYIHFDVDVLDPDTAPAMNYLAAGGPNETELEQVFRFLAQTGSISAVSVSSWNPTMDVEMKTRDVSMRLLTVLLE